MTRRMAFIALDKIFKAFIRSLSFASFNTVVYVNHSTASSLSRHLLKGSSNTETWEILRDSNVIQKKKKKKKTQILVLFVEVAVNIFDASTLLLQRRMLGRQDVNGGTTGRSLRSACMYVIARIMRETKARILVFRTKHGCLSSHSVLTFDVSLR